MIASFLYQGDVPEPDTLLDMAREALVAEIDSNIDADTCQAIVEGLVRAWTAAREHERREEEDPEEERFCSAAAAEAAYRKRAVKVYVHRVRQAFPKFNPSEDGALWWPEGMTYRSGWPKAFVRAIAMTLGEIEGDRSVAVFRYMAERRAEEAKSADATP